MFFATAEFQSSFCVFATIECSKKKIGLMSKYVSSFDMDCSSDIRYTSICKQRCVLIDKHKHQNVSDPNYEISKNVNKNCMRNCNVLLLYKLSEYMYK